MPKTGRTLGIDIETYSGNELTKCGVYKYAEADDFAILLLGYAWDDEAVRVVDLARGEVIPAEVLEAICDDGIIKTAFNAQFERICLSQHLGQSLSPKAWRCTMLQGALLGLPLSLEGVGAVLQLEEQKIKEGKALIRHFSKPCTPTKANNGRTRNLPRHDPTKWADFKEYNRRDVEVEREIRHKLAKFPIPEAIQNEYILDQEINDRGVAVDMPFVENAILCDTQNREQHEAQMRRLAEIDNPNSVAQLKNWLAGNGLQLASLGKKDVAEAIETAPEPLREVLILRQKLAKSSVKKYTAIQNAVCENGRIRGMFQFYGANRTGRWSGRLVQLQNLAQNHIPN